MCVAHSKWQWPNLIAHFNWVQQATIRRDAHLFGGTGWQASKGQLNFRSKDTFLEMVDRVVQTLTAAGDPLAANAEPSIQKIANVVDVVFHTSSKEEALIHSNFYKVHIRVVSVPPTPQRTARLTTKSLARMQDSDMERPARTHDSFVSARTRKA
eukprot:SAG11_NODE_18917_length_478_cov_0.944591_1_plen_154_part_01